MPRAFEITSDTPAIKLSGTGQGEVSFTVSNTLGRPVRARATVEPEGNAPPGWFTIVGSPEWNLPVDGVQKVTVKVAAPPGTNPGSYSFHLLVRDADDPEGQFTASGWVYCLVPPQGVPARRFDVFWAGAIAGILVVVGVLAFSFLPGRPGSRGRGPRPLATVSYALDASRTSTLPAAGAGEGPPFRDSCPPGHVATGFEFQGGRALSAFKLACRPLHPDATLGQPVFTRARGDVPPPGATAVAAECPRNELLVGQGVALNRDAPSQVGGPCVSAERLGLILPEEAIRVGVLTTEVNADCPPGTVVTGAYGRAGDRVSQLGFVCTALVQQPPLQQGPPVVKEGRPGREERSGRRAQPPPR